MIDNDSPIENDNHSHLDNVQADTMPDALMIKLYTMMS